MIIKITSVYNGFNSKALNIDKSSLDIDKIEPGDYIINGNELIKIIRKSEIVLTSDPPIPTGEFILSCDKDCKINPGEYEVVKG